MDMCIGTPIRHDRSNALYKQLKESGLPIEGDVTVIDTLVMPALLQYGEFALAYWIDDAPEPQQAAAPPAAPAREQDAVSLTPPANTGKAAPGIGCNGAALPEKSICYDDDLMLGKKLPRLEELDWFQGNDVAQAALSSPQVKVILFWAKFAKSEWLTIQQFQNLSVKYPSVNFLGISCDPKEEECKKMLKKANSGDFPEINLYNFKYTFPAAYDVDGKVRKRFMKLGGLQTMGAGYALIVDKFQTIVWKENINMTHLIEANQFLDQLDSIVQERGSAKKIVKNGPAPEDDASEEEMDAGADLSGVCNDADDPFADEGNGDY
jgi:hypothetical protein